MQFIPIAPTAHIQTYSAESEYVFALAHMGKDEDYLKQMVDLSYEKKLILDNGAYEEEPMSPHEIVTLWKNARIYELVLPDVLQSAWQTSQKFAQFLHQYDSEHFKGVERFMIVPQGRNHIEAAVCLKKMVELYHLLGIEKGITLGIPKHFHSFSGGRLSFIHRILRNVEASDWFSQYIAQQQIHLLGMGETYFDLVHFNTCHVRSMDSARPFVLSFAGVGLLDPKPKRQDEYFYRIMDGTQQLNAAKNIAEIRGMLA